MTASCTKGLQIFDVAYDRWVNCSFGFRSDMMRPKVTADPDSFLVVQAWGAAPVCGFNPVDEKGRLSLACLQRGAPGMLIGPD